MIWIVYASEAVVDMTADALSTLLAQARTANSERGVTGMLLYRDRRFLQVLEGPERAVRERLDLIRSDPRHQHLRVLLDEPIARRQFSEWTMGFPAITDGVAALPGFRTTFHDIDLKRDDHTVGSWALRELVQAFRPDGGRAHANRGR